MRRAFHLASIRTMNDSLYPRRLNQQLGQRSQRHLQIGSCYNRSLDPRLTMLQNQDSHLKRCRLLLHPSTSPAERQIVQPRLLLHE